MAERYARGKRMRQGFSVEHISNEDRRGWSRPDAEGNLSVSLIGPVSATIAGRQINLKFRKAAAILGYLCLQDRMAARRERLAHLLWGENDEGKARASLRQVIALLRRELSGVGFDGLSATKLTVSLVHQRVDVDILRILQDADRLEVHPLLMTQQRLPEGILEGLEDLDEEFRSWLLPMRQAIHNRLERSLNAGLSDLSVNTSGKFKIATALLGLDPTNERACRYIVAAHAKWGDVAAAVRVFEQLSYILAHDHGVKPTTETQKLIEDIQRGGFKRQSGLATNPVHFPYVISNKNRPQSSESGQVRRSSAAAAEHKAIALRLEQFELHGVSSDKSYLVTGFRHELVACLVRFRGWSIVESRSATPTAPLASFASEYRLEGTAYQARQTINLVLTLLDAARGAYIWSESFELRLDNWFEAQHRLICRLAASLNISFSAERVRRSSSQPDVSLETYDKWLMAEALLATFRADNWQKARRILDDAKNVSPAFSPLYSCSVQMSNIESIVFPGILRNANKAAQTVGEARMAVHLDPLDSRAHLCLGWALASAQDFEAAAPHMQHARELNYNDPWTTLSGALFWAYTGDIDRAQELLATSMALAFAFAPREWAYCGTVRFLSGDYVGAIEAFELANDVTKAIAAWQAAAMALVGRIDEAIAQAQKFLQAARFHWFDAVPASDFAIARWVLQSQPLGRREHWSLLRDGLKRAAVPVDHIEDRIW